MLREEITILKKQQSKGTLMKRVERERGENLLDKERKLKSMESKKQAQESKHRAATLVAEHKKRERQLIKQGKAPYFLKRSDQKKLLLVDKYSRLGEKELDHVIERRRKSKGAKARKNLPRSRRVVV